ncbi:hypothetical protein OHA25_38890 [Nonomuraea sp. NBC_00507]|uniref:hypothetical protein n=1 Tax=Nonomuraea sp. NBC_00507 TaxID=2976002 RepID=UPI002E198EBA
MVDGYGPHKPGLDAARWVACDRCGIRPDPQGNLDPEQDDVGQPYPEPIHKFGPSTALLAAFEPNRPVHWPRKPTGTLGGELVLGKTFGVFSAEVTIGAVGAEHTLSAHLRRPLSGVLKRSSWSAA